LPAKSVNAKKGGLALLLGDNEEAAWELLPVNETSYGYFAKVPELRAAASDRLVYFIRYLEHPDAVVAADVYSEFGRAPYDDVARVADRLPMMSIRAWLVDERVPQERKGLYGLMLGLAKDDATRRANIELLRTVIEQPASDFRAGFDGVLGGYLVAAGEPGLERTEERFLANPNAARGDVLHAMTALRFYAEFGHGIGLPRLAEALSHLLDRPEFAAAAIVDLARWKAWDTLPKVVGLYGRKGYAEPAIERSVIGFLLVCPQPQATQELTRLRQLAPERVAEAEQAVFSGVGSR
jgi:hypothetical protein